MNICQTNLYPGRSFLLPSSCQLLFFPFNRRKSMTHLSSCSPLGQRQIWAHELTVIVGHLSGDFIFFLIIKLNKVGCLLLCVRAQSISHVDPAEGLAGPQQSADTEHIQGVQDFLGENCFLTLRNTLIVLFTLLF